MAPIFTRVELLVFALVWLTRLYCGGACSSAQYEECQKKHKNNDLAVITKEYDDVFWLCSAKTDQALFPRAWYPVSRGKNRIFRSRDWSNPQRDKVVSCGRFVDKNHLHRRGQTLRLLVAERWVLHWRKLCMLATKCCQEYVAWGLYLKCCYFYKFSFRALDAFRSVRGALTLNY